MSEFEQWLKSLNENGRVTYFLGQESKIAEEAWNHRQSEIDQIKVQLSLQRDRNKALEAELTSSRNYGDQLKAQLIDQGQRFNDQSQKVKDLEHQNEKLKAEKAGLAKLAKQWREESKELCRVDDKYVIGALLSCAERLEEAVRGEH